MEQLKSNLKEMFNTLENIRLEYRMGVQELCDVLELSRDAIDNIRMGLRDAKVKIELVSILLLQYATYNHPWYKKFNGETKRFIIPVGDPSHRLRVTPQRAINLRKQKVSREELQAIFKASDKYRYVRWEKDWLEGIHYPSYLTIYTYCNHLGVKELVYTEAEVLEMIKRRRDAYRNKQDVKTVIQQLRDR